MKMKKLTDVEVSRILSGAAAGALDYYNPDACYSAHAFGGTSAVTGDVARWWMVSHAVGDASLLRRRGIGFAISKTAVRPRHAGDALRVLRKAELV